MPYWTEEEYNVFAGCEWGKDGEVEEGKPMCEGGCECGALEKELRKMSPYERRQIMALENIAYRLGNIQGELDAIDDRLVSIDDSISSQ
jgi:hypothetical protein